MSRKRLAAAALAAALGAVAPAESFAAAAGAQVLSREIGPRAAGLGGAYTALARGAESIWWNPAGLARTGSPEAGFVQSRGLEDFGLYALQAAAPRRGDAGFGLGVLYADYGTFELVDRSGATQFGRYSAGDLVATGGAARSWAGGRWSAGVSGKLIQQRIESESARGAAFDFGGLFRSGDWSAGAVLKNLGRNMRFREQSNPMPAALRLGGGWTPVPGASLAVDLVKPRDLGLSERIGGEYQTAPAWGLRAALRLGYSTEASAFSGLTYGFGVKSESWSFDFAVEPADGHPASWIGLSGRFAGSRSAEAPAPVPPPAAAHAPLPPPPAQEAPGGEKRSPERVLSDTLAWYRRKVAEGLLTIKDREDVLKRLLGEFEPLGVNVEEVRQEIRDLTGGKK